MAPDTDALIDVYAINNIEHLNTNWPHSYFTASWVQGEGRKAIRAEITKRLASIREEKSCHLSNFIDKMHAEIDNPSRKAWVRAQVSKGLQLTPEERHELRRVTGDRMTLPYTDFTNAPHRLTQDSIKEAVKAHATIVSVVFDVVLGLVPPGLSQGNSLWQHTPSQFSNLSYRIALGALDTRQTERRFAAATKVGKEATKANAQALFGETDTDIFIRNLKKSFREAIDKVNGDLPIRTDLELGVLSELTIEVCPMKTITFQSSRELVSRFRHQVIPIGKIKSHSKRIGTDWADWETESGVVWAQVGTDEYLVQYTRTNYMFSEGSYSFVTFVDSDLMDALLLGLVHYSADEY